jgi:hypothetical protein
MEWVWSRPLVLSAEGETGQMRAASAEAKYLCGATGKTDHWQAAKAPAARRDKWVWKKGGSNRAQPGRLHSPG